MQKDIHETRKCTQNCVCNITDITTAILRMEEHLNNELFVKNGIIEEKKLWKNTYINKQIQRRKNGDSFSLEDHIRAMVYSMLSSSMPWDRIAKDVDIETGKITTIDNIFSEYHPTILLESSPETLRDMLKGIHCAGQSTLKQMKALVEKNINLLLAIEKDYGNIDAFYTRLSKCDATYKTLIHSLSDSESEYKLTQMGIPLVAEYLRNVGYDIAKPDRHIQRILGRDILGLSEHKIVPLDECFDIVFALAQATNRNVAEVDYILWAYCSKGYGEICTKNNPKCDDCTIKMYCKIQ